MANGRPPQADRPRPVIIRKGPAAVDIEIDFNTVSNGHAILPLIEGEIGPGNPNRVVTLAGKQLIINQPCASLIAKVAKEAGYQVRLRIPGSEDKSNLHAPLLEMLDGIDEE